MTNRLIKMFLSDVLLLGFSFAWFALIILPLLLADGHVYGLWYEYNPFILITEAIMCIFACAWAIIKIVATIRRERANVDA